MFDRSNRTLPLTVLMLLLASCGPSQTYVQGVAAEASGDWHNAVVNYRAALVEDPNDTQVRVRLYQAEQQLALVTASRVAHLLQDEDFQGALDAIEPEIALLPDDTTLLQSLESIRLQGLNRFSSDHAAGSHRQAYEGAVLLQRSFPEDPEIRDLRFRARADFAQQLRERAIEAENNGRLGLALAGWVGHFDLFGDQESQVRAATCREALAREIAYHYRIDFDRLLAGRPLPALPDGLLAWPASEDEAQVTIRAGLGEPRFEERYTVSIAYQSYLAGYETVPNPAYGSALWNVEQAERDVLYQEREVLEEEEDVHLAEVALNQHRDQDDYDSYFSRWDSAVRDLQREREELLYRRERLQWARERLRDTPPTFVQEVWSDFPYEVREYTLTATADFTAQVHPTGSPVRAIHEQLRTSTTDSAHDGFPHVGLAHDPLQYPYSQATLTELLENHAAQTVQAVLLHEYDAYRERYRADGLTLVHSDPESAVESLVRYALLNPSSVSPDVATWLDELADLWDCRLLGPMS